jgi:SAM-dependent methyltransferase
MTSAMKRVSCYLCGSNKSSVLIRYRGPDRYLELIDPSLLAVERTWAACDDCGFVYHQPQVDPSLLMDMYRKTYRSPKFRQEEPNAYFDRIRAIPPEKSENFEKANWLTRYLKDAGRGSGHILDVGCGGGVFLATFMAANPSWRACGFEPNEDFAKMVAERVGILVRGGQAYRPGLFDGRFDAITCIHVLEHIADPVSFLREISMDLAPDGIVFVEVPEIEDFVGWPIDDDRFMSPHFHYYSPESLATVAERAGLSMLVMKREVVSRKNFLRMVARAGSVLPDALNRTPPSRILSLKRPDAA